MLHGGLFRTTLDDIRQGTLYFVVEFDSHMVLRIREYWPGVEEHHTLWKLGAFIASEYNIQGYSLGGARNSRLDRVRESTDWWKACVGGDYYVVDAGTPIPTTPSHHIPCHRSGKSSVFICFKQIDKAFHWWI